ncbi:unnamed protein product [Fusarium graminearum]|nr:unnamed protein product [Fusarium graminearum]
MSSLFARQDPNPELCVQYASFASHLVRWQFKIIYWTMFVSNLLVLFIASWTYIRYVFSLSLILISHLTITELKQQPKS